MPRRGVLTPSGHASVLAFPTADDELTYHYTFDEPDISVIRQHRGAPNRLGFAIQLCAVRYPGFALPLDVVPPAPLLLIVARQLPLNPELWPQYAQRSETRREHLLELQAWLGLTPFGREYFGQLVHQLTDLAQQSDRGMVLATAMVETLREQRTIVPAIA